MAGEPLPIGQMSAVCEGDPAPAALRRAVLCACHADVQSFKPGNVAVGAPAHGMSAEQFLRSAEVVAPLLATKRLALGARIEAAVRASMDAAGCNTNLGIVLLLAPMAEAALRTAAGAERPDWRGQLPAVLAATSRDDGAAAARAIVRAHPAGLGSVDEADVQSADAGACGGGFGHTLQEAMALAAGRDQIACQYVSDFSTVHQMAAHLVSLTGNGANREDAVSAVFLHRLMREPDTHILRKHGPKAAWAVMHEVRLACVGLPDPPRWTAPDVRRLAALHDALLVRRINPGTTADLMVAAVFATELDAMQNF
jgi:triphosphoribosyl-dephospho-CoA synthase